VSVIRAVINALRHLFCDAYARCFAKIVIISPTAEAVGAIQLMLPKSAVVEW